ncbi:unnamed protein product [Prunus armeniaca]
MEMAEDTCVWHRLVGQSPRGRPGVQGGEDLEPRLGYEGEWGPITCPGRVASTWLVVVAIFVTLVVAEGGVGVDTEADGGLAKVFRARVVPKVGLAEATLESIEGSSIVSLYAARVLMAKLGCILPKGFILTLPKHVQVVCGVQGRTTKGGREDEAHAFVTKALASESRLE